MKNKKPRISVIVANYNGESFIKDCISSILKEENDFELLVIDDKSADDSVEILKKIILQLF